MQNLLQNSDHSIRLSYRPVGVIIDKNILDHQFDLNRLSDHQHGFSIGRLTDDLLIFFFFFNEDRSFPRRHFGKTFAVTSNIAKAFESYKSLIFKLPSLIIFISSFSEVITTVVDAPINSVVLQVLSLPPFMCSSLISTQCPLHS